MPFIEVIHMVKSTWLQLSARALTRGSGKNEVLLPQLERFYELLEQAVSSDNPTLLDPILVEWTALLPKSDLEGPVSSLTSIIKELTLSLFQAVYQLPDSSLAMDTIGLLLPYFTHAFEIAAQSEMQAKVAFLSAQLDQLQQELERLDRSKSDFISVSAHELRTPLTLVEGYASMLRETLEKTGYHPHQEILLDGIQNGARRLRLIIDDIIDVSLIDNNLMTLNFQPVWLDRLWSILADEFAPIVAERKQRLIIRPFPGSSEMTFGDPERLLQAFRNVLTNAVKYTPDGGEIEVNGRKLPGFLEVTVRDTGIGLDPDVTQLIFDKFIRFGSISLHSSSKSKFKGGGPGLGLHITKGILEAHGGAIWAESPGHDEVTCPGTTFHIMIPLRSEPADAKMAKIFSALTQNNPLER